MDVIQKRKMKRKKGDAITHWRMGVRWSSKEVGSKSDREKARSHDELMHFDQIQAAKQD